MVRATVIVTTAAAATAVITAAAAATLTAATAVAVTIAAAAAVAVTSAAIVTARRRRYRHHRPPPSSPPSQSPQPQISQRAARELGICVPGPEDGHVQRGRTRRETARRQGSAGHGLLSLMAAREGIGHT